ncbi:MAG: hypothetical protein SXV54_22855 [Chloroflexota bacterium]|nr:hypothetical protein [Chloroflexota bacterium]
MVRKIKRQAKKPAQLTGIPPGMRMKGGVGFDPAVNGFVVIVHVWGNISCHGEPEEWRYPEVFPTEDVAMRYYKKHIRPSLKQMMAETAKEHPGREFTYRELE